MTSEEIIQRLLDEKKISAKEAMVILKDIVKNTMNSMFGVPTYGIPDVQVMYGIVIPDFKKEEKDNAGE